MKLLCYVGIHSWDRYLTSYDGDEKIYICVRCYKTKTLVYLGGEGSVSGWKKV